MKSAKQSKAKKAKKSKSSTPAIPLPPGWDESAGLRETFLYHFPRPEDSAALRHVIAILQELILETPRPPETAPSPDVTPTRLELAAITRDLRHSQGSLQQLARGPEVSELSPVDAALARFAGQKAEELAFIAAALERALG